MEFVDGLFFPLSTLPSLSDTELYLASFLVEDEESEDPFKPPGGTDRSRVTVRGRQQ